ncbi:hypothetical protein N8813_02990 [bacterium]|nr:hypothetical protein [bacterium]MDB4657943.1 hypothetical protein [Verrucomicrobiales bacterium]MDC0311897.1 hypothetical protein [bacterium]MDC0314498.1 hypothetical protein [bacterium]
MKLNFFLFLAIAAALPALGQNHKGDRYELSVRASEINPEAKEHPEIGYVFADQKGKPADLQYGAVDTRVKSEGKLVIWLMGHNRNLFDRTSSYGLHGIQVHYANRWFGLVPDSARSDDSSLGEVRLEAATGEDHSKLVDIPKPDGMKAKALTFVKWLEKENPEGKWGQFVTKDGKDLIWESVIMAGSSHGSTTSARFAVHQKVGRVVMFCGPRDRFQKWQGFPSATPANRFFGFSHVLDGGWSGNHYCRSWQMLGLNEFGPIVNVDKTPAPFGNSRRLVSDADVGGNDKKAHGMVTPGGSSAKNEDGTFAHESVWKYLFTHPIDKTGAPVPIDPDCKVLK